VVAAAARRASLPRSQRLQQATTVGRRLSRAMQRDRLFVVACFEVLHEKEVRITERRRRYAPTAGDGCRLPPSDIDDDRWFPRRPVARLLSRAPSCGELRMGMGIDSELRVAPSPPNTTPFASVTRCRLPLVKTIGLARCTHCIFLSSAPRHLSVLAEGQCCRMT
jgi:hypothetical protein